MTRVFSVTVTFFYLPLFPQTRPYSLCICPKYPVHCLYEVWGESLCVRLWLIQEYVLQSFLFFSSSFLVLFRDKRKKTSVVITHRMSSFLVKKHSCQCPANVPHFVNLQIFIINWLSMLLFSQGECDCRLVDTVTILIHSSTFLSLHFGPCTWALY